MIVHCSYARLVESGMFFVDLFLGFGKILGACACNFAGSIVADLDEIPDLPTEMFWPTADLGKRGLYEC